MPRKFSPFNSAAGIIATADYLPTFGNSSSPRKPISLLRLYNPTWLLVSLSFIFCLSGVIFALYAVLGPIPTFRCGRVEDTFRPFYSLSQRPGGESMTNGVLTDRIKFVGLVGIQTGFGSRDRRRALRSTWFPSHPDALLRYYSRTSIGKSNMYLK